MALASGLSLAVGAYLNAKLFISTDLSSLYYNRSAMKRMGQSIMELEGTATVYKLLERVVDVHGHGSKDAIWFEGKTWSYSQLKDRECGFVVSLLVLLIVVQLSTDLRLFSRQGISKPAMSLAFLLSTLQRWWLRYMRSLNWVLCRLFLILVFVVCIKYTPSYLKLSLTRVGR